MHNKYILFYFGHFDHECHETNPHYSEGELTRNRLVLAAVNRSLVNKVITCEASNTELALPRHASVQLDLVLAPLDIAITGARGPVVRGEEVSLTCTVTGARPLPVITWLGEVTRTRAEVQYKVSDVCP